MPVKDEKELAAEHRGYNTLAEAPDTPPRPRGPFTALIALLVELAVDEYLEEIN